MPSSNSNINEQPSAWYQFEN
ncbi:unnamed protein product, partial [Rotaria magnacalcarata]